MKNMRFRSGTYSMEGPRVDLTEDERLERGAAFKRFEALMREFEGPEVDGPMYREYALRFDAVVREAVAINRRFNFAKDRLRDLLEQCVEGADRELGRQLGEFPGTSAFDAAVRKARQKEGS